MTDEQELRQEIIDGFEALEPTSGFADSVMLAIASESPESSRDSTRRLGGWFGIGAAALALIVGTWGARNVSSGTYVANERTHLEVGKRAAAVLEAGTEIAWDTDVFARGRIRQNAGNAFYRVDPGTSFAIQTPAGNIVVHGTCLRVEVRHMHVSKNEIGKLATAGTTGAILAATVVVTVYEGRVAVANEHGTTALTAGQVASMRSGKAPSPARNAGNAPSLREPDATHDSVSKEHWSVRGKSNQRATNDADMSYDELRTAYERQKREFEKLQRKTRVADPESDFYPPNQESLDAMVEDCSVQADTASVFRDESSHGFSNVAVDELNITPEEIEVIERIQDEVREQTKEIVRRSYLDLGGAETVADEVGLFALFQQLHRMDQSVAPLERIARERAGLVAPPAAGTPLSPKEEAVRWVTNIGNLIQDRVAKELGKERAHELRSYDAGWPGGRSTWGGCGDKKKK